MSQPNKDHARALARREAVLKSRIAQRQAKNEPTSFDEAELAALVWTWAILDKLWPGTSTTARADHARREERRQSRRSKR